jgi:hypothetical protein
LLLKVNFSGITDATKPLESIKRIYAYGKSPPEYGRKIFMKSTTAKLSRIAIITTISLLLTAVAFRAGPVSASPTC